MPGVGLASRGIDAVAAHPDTKIAPGAEIPTPYAVSNHPSGVDGGSVFARQRGCRFAENALIHPSWNWSPQHPCENPDTTTRLSRTAMSVAYSASEQLAHPGVAYFHRSSPPGLYARTNQPSPSHSPRRMPIR